MAPHDFEHAPVNEDVGARLRVLRSLGRLYSASFVVVGFLAIVLPFALGLGAGHGSGDPETAYDVASVNRLACSLLSLMGAWAALAGLGAAAKRLLIRWAYRE